MAKQKYRSVIIASLLLIFLISTAAAQNSRTNTLQILPVTVPIGHLATMSVMMDYSDIPVNAFSFTVHFDPNAVTIMDADLGDLASGFEALLVYVSWDGRLGISASGTIPIPAGSSGEIIQISFTILTSDSYLYIDNMGEDFTGWSAGGTWIEGCIPEINYLYRHLPGVCFPGEPFVIEYAQGPGPASIETVNETLPAGWTVLAPPWDEHTGDTFTWNDRIQSATVLPPADAAGGSYYFDGYTDIWHWCAGESQQAIEGHNVIQVFTPTATPTPCVHSGDVDAGGTITPDDALSAFHIYLGVTIDPTTAEQCAADCNADSSITPEDSLCILINYLSGFCACADML